MLRAMIVDDEELAVERLRMVLTEFSEIHICHAALNPKEAYEYAKTNLIDLVFLDISMPEINGLKLSDLLHELNPDIDVVFVTGYDDYAVQAFHINALDYLLKPATVQRMSITLDKIRKRHQNRHDWSMLQALNITPEESLSLRKILTEQETRIVLLIAEGLSNKEISRRLNIAGETVKFHIKNVYRKLGVLNRVQALQRVKQLLSTL